MGLGPTDYLRQAIAGNEEAIVVTREGELACVKFALHES
jgi:hypothetical protein